VRSVEAGDADALARHMLDSYMGTIDYDGETLEDAISEVGGYFDSSALLEHSFVATSGDGVVSAVLVTLDGGQPFIAYVMTTPSHKNQRLARLVTATAMSSLAGAGHDEAHLYITDGNVESEALFRALGAVPVEDSD
jgi:hypothetical protein